MIGCVLRANIGADEYPTDHCTYFKSTSASGLGLCNELQKYLKPPLILAVSIWLLALLIYASASAIVIFQDKSDAFSAKADEMATCLDRRIAQNFAFVRSFEVFATLSGKEATDIFGALVRHTMEQNPRIRQVNLYQHGHDDNPLSATLVANYPPGENDEAVRSIVSDVVKQPLDTIRGFADPRFPGRFFTAVHSERNNFHYTIVMLVDVKEMLGPLLSEASTKIEWLIGGVPAIPSGPRPSGLSRLLTLEKTIIAGPNTLAPQDFTWFPDGTAFRISETISLAALFDALDFLVYCGLSTIAVVAGYSALHQRQLSKRLQQSEEEALGRAARLEKENRLEHAARVNAVGELAAGIIHELAQPLTSLLSQSQASLIMLEQKETQIDLVQRAMVANIRDAKRASRILGKIRDYIVQTTIVPEMTNLNIAIQDILEILSLDIERHGVSLALRLAEPSPVANINKTELEQVIHNLLRNALDALNPSEQMNKRITIETRVEPNESIIRVSDNGPGLSDDTLSQLFQPFFTTKSDGMGLGLSLCQRIIQRASGVLAAANNEGAAFTIKLPRTEAVGQSMMTMDEVVAVSDRYIDQKYIQIA